MRLRLMSGGKQRASAADRRGDLKIVIRIPDEQRPRVVIVSALSSLRDRAKAAELGADAYMPKPFNVEELLRVLHGLEEAS
jgi:DNA-binding response OmpR family regulator